MSASAPSDSGARARLTSRAALASLSVAFLLLLLKGYAAWRTDSVAMLSSLADTGLDLVAALVTFWGLRIAAVPADREHRFGHGKAEALAALFQVVLIALSAMGIASRALGRLGAGAQTADAEQGIFVSLVALGLTGVLIAYQRRVIAATGSVAIRADRIHYTSDLLLNGAVIVALVLDQYWGLRGADPLVGIAIALWLRGGGAWGAAATAIDQLMDKEWPEERRQRFLAVAARHPALRGIHDLRTRSSGAHDFVQFHVWVDPAISVAEAHRVMDEVEAALTREFPGVEILIHPDPEGHADQAVA